MHPNILSIYPKTLSINLKTLLGRPKTLYTHPKSLSTQQKSLQTHLIILPVNSKTLQTHAVFLSYHFKTLPPHKIAFPRGVTHVKKFKDTETIYRKGTPMHVRAALLFNHMVKENSLRKKYELINKDGKARRGRLTFDRGVVETPAFMPVGTYGTVKGMKTEEVEASAETITTDDTKETKAKTTQVDAINIKQIMFF